MIYDKDVDLKQAVHFKNIATILFNDFENKIIIFYAF